MFIHREVERMIELSGTGKWAKASYSLNRKPKQKGAIPDENLWISDGTCKSVHFACHTGKQAK